MTLEPSVRVFRSFGRVLSMAPRGVARATVTNRASFGWRPP